MAAQDDNSATNPPTEEAPADPSAAAAAAAQAAEPRGVPPRLNLLVTVPRDEASAADLRECRDDEEAAAINGEIVVCRVRGNDGTGLTGTRAESQKRYAQETMLKGAPRAPDFIADCKDQGNPFGCIGIGKVPPVAITVDFAALPTAPAGSDADRIARGLPPLGQNEELSEEQERARREAEGIKTTVPARPTKKKGG
ncbi:MAG: hypothetical protein NBV68_12250 [Erythrobacter sp.]|uniref:hypothetical protein n=1 Tax=Erythrobacter sp. TaxID=1042 RepID=UPI0025E47B05|nr:hypothetical protein [Erythrobacter sp.]MCM0000148.1 hypothetical protein [Erythrobacter sp.]